MNNCQWHMVSPEPRGVKPEHIECAEYALAYLDAALVLSLRLSENPEAVNFAAASVPMYLQAHAVEQFLKGAVLRRSPEERFGHDLEHLYNRYVKLYSGKRYAFTKPPFQADYGDLSAVEIALAKKLAPGPEGLYRYPRDKEGQHWHGAFGIELMTWPRELKILRADFERLLAAYDS